MVFFVVADLEEASRVLLLWDDEAPWAEEADEGARAAR